MKRIALLGPAPPFRGGISQFALMLAGEFLQEGYDVRMYTFDRQYPKLLFPGGEQTTSFADLPEIPVERVFTPYLPQTWTKAVERIREFQPDLLITSYFLPWFAPSFAWICKRLPNTRRICLAHNIDFHEKWPGADLLSRKFFQHCERIVLLSEACLNDLKRKMPESISRKALLGFHPIYGCYGTSEGMTTAEEPKQPTALFFGLIKAYKGLDVLLAALKQARRRVPDLKLIVAGEVYGKAAKYEHLIRELGLSEAVEARFHYITDDEIAEVFRQARVCVLPYKSATQSGVIATAYSFQMPVIASDVGGLSEYISEGDTGLLVPPNNPEALAAALIRFFEEEDLRARMSASIPSYIEKFSWPKLAALILEA